MLRILQLSDTHLHADRNMTLHGISTQESLEQLLANNEAKIATVDAIILSGDVSQDRSAESYGHIAKSLQMFKKPVYWFAGNHDAPRVMHDTLQQFNTFHPLGSLTLGSWQFLVLDTFLEDSDAGYLTINDESVIHENTFCALWMHHHPTPVGTDSIDKYKLQNPETLAHFLSQQKNLPTVIITGHVHGAYQTRFDTIPVISSPATCFQFPQVAPNLEIDPIGGCTFWVFHDDGTFEYEYVYTTRE
ncbi:MAG: Metallophosphoesterase, partial [Gammaproteobacteria bacterium]|nr:Metallophosphoesterase [Gammaproteobacteria bacterium]